MKIMIVPDWFFLMMVSSPMDIGAWELDWGSNYRAFDVKKHAWALHYTHSSQKMMGTYHHPHHHDENFILCSENRLSFLVQSQLLLLNRFLLVNIQRLDSVVV
ncbi:hypothetical protein Drorol1_Dr00015340 [Drosera rotundifolia]